MSPLGISLEAQLRNLDVSDDEIEDRLVIGIDFGTTYSGVGWATKADFEDKQVNFITSWPGTGREEGKVPTEIWYDEDNEPAWGYEVPPDGEPFRWFKLLLLRTEDLGEELQQSEFMRRAKAMAEAAGREPVDLVADYLRLLWEHTISTIERTLGEDVVDAFTIHVVITLPAIWKGYARQAMQDAAKEAGILDSRMAGDTTISFAIEPEVAALSTLLDRTSGVKPGNVYIICDAGGGTVDLISYEVKSTKPIVLQEAVEGEGGLCGGIFVDQTFEHLCKGRLGPKWKRLSNTGIREIMREEWENGIKPQFKSPKQRKEYPVRIPAEAFSGKDSLNDTSREPHIKSGRIHFLGGHIEKTFAGVLAEIEDLIGNQIQKATGKGLSVTGIILVGGLGGSPCLYEKFKDLYSKAGIAVLQAGGMKPRTAICRGAVLKGFLENQGETGAPISITGRVSRASYGISFRTLFNKCLHLEEDKVWDINEGVWRASNQMSWSIKRGDIVSQVKPVRRPWYRLFEESEFHGTLAFTIYHCDAVLAPIRRTTSVRTLGKLYIELDVEYSDLPDFVNKNGLKLKRLDYETEWIVSGASVEFVVYINGRKQGSESVKICYE